MLVRVLALLISSLTITGCSTYDVLAISADLAVAVFSDDDEDRSPGDDSHRFWDPAVSSCIRVEKSKNSIERRLDAIERGKEYVVLPTGERYPVTPAGAELPMAGPTEKCLAARAD